ncbi:hypothetical protein DV515_00004828 [Chloebia gouldiae]|uniref:Uncharacterized protein n=1 Tax=Chloebia gouldiae TaxID=44316 RepID=A0A3L8SPP7_CHLGU|nr:hypothetical protein DV515_00004828 [Chloebia gouldiae]
MKLLEQLWLVELVLLSHVQQLMLTSLPCERQMFIHSAFSSYDKSSSFVLSKNIDSIDSILLPLEPHAFALYEVICPKRHNTFKFKYCPQKQLNSAPVKGFEKDVGGKTTLRITYPEGAIQKMEQYEKDSLFVLAGFKWQDFKWLKYIVYKEKVTGYLGQVPLKQCESKGLEEEVADEGALFPAMQLLLQSLSSVALQQSIAYPDFMLHSASDGFWKSVATRVPREPHEIRILNPYFIQEAAFSFIGLPFNNGLMGRGNIPTLGSVAITMALHNCDEVAVAGFGYDMSSPNAPLHYYENIKMSAIKEALGSMGSHLLDSVGSEQRPHMLFLCIRTVHLYNRNLNKSVGIAALTRAQSWTHNIQREKEFLRKLVKARVITDLTSGI